MSRIVLTIIVFIVIFATSCSSDASWSPELHNKVIFSDNFSLEEKAYILEGFNVWKRETNCPVEFVEGDNGIKILKATDEEMLQFDKEHHETVVGLAVKRSESKIYFVFQRIDSFEELQLVAAHEAGHHLGMEHIPQEETAIMNPAVNKLLFDDQHLTQYDLDQFNNYWRCK